MVYGAGEVTQASVFGEISVTAGILRLCGVRRQTTGEDPHTPSIRALISAASRNRRLPSQQHGTQRATPSSSVMVSSKHNFSGFLKIVRTAIWR